MIEKFRSVVCCFILMKKIFEIFKTEKILNFLRKKFSDLPQIKKKKMKRLKTKKFLFTSKKRKVKKKQKKFRNKKF